MQTLGDAAPLRGRVIAFERLVGSNFIREDEPLPAFDIASTPVALKTTPKAHPKGRHLRLVVSRDQPEVVQYEPDATLRRVLDAFNGAAVASDSKLVS